MSKNLLLIKNMLYGSAESEPQTDIVVAQVAQEFYNNNLLFSLICNLSKIDFEVRENFRRFPLRLRSPNNFSEFFFSTRFLGEERCRPSIQQYPEKTNRHTISYSRIHLHETRNSVHTDVWVSGVNAGRRCYYSPIPIDIKMLITGTSIKISP